MSADRDVRVIQMPGGWTVALEETTWPVDGYDNGLGWKLRYSDSVLTRSERLFAASVMDAYRAIASFRQPLSTANAKMRRARQAHLIAFEHETALDPQ